MTAARPPSALAGCTQRSLGWVIDPVGSWAWFRAFESLALTPASWRGRVHPMVRGAGETSRQPARVFLLSPARLDGIRARMIFEPRVPSALSEALRTREGAPIG